MLEHLETYVQLTWINFMSLSLELNSYKFFISTVALAGEVFLLGDIQRASFGINHKSNKRRMSSGWIQTCTTSELKSERTFLIAQSLLFGISKRHMSYRNLWRSSVFPMFQFSQIVKVVQPLSEGKKRMFWTEWRSFVYRNQW